MIEPQSMDTAPKGVEVELLYDFPQPKGLQWVTAIYKNDRFWSKDVDGWWSPDGGMWVDGWIKAWRPK